MAFHPRISPHQLHGTPGQASGLYGSSASFLEMATLPLAAAPFYRQAPRALVARALAQIGLRLAGLQIRRAVLLADALPWLGPVYM
eukprot:scaffold7069_cov19-Tisochrysis_lutea.AAC.1